MSGKSDMIGNEILYGPETEKALANFALASGRVNMRLVYAIVTIKKAAALTYADLDGAGAAKFLAIAEACDEVLAGRHDDAFVTDALQGGAGTSTHMNVNEVLATLATRALAARRRGAADSAAAATSAAHAPAAPANTAPAQLTVHPLDDVNRGQSTNDVYPTALRIAAIGLLRELADSCAALQESLQKKENEYDGIPKLGRTELMDAVPVTLGQEFGAWAQAIGRDRWRLYKMEERLRQVNLGGTAVGGGDNADRQYRYGVLERLREMTGIGLAAAEYPMDITQNNDVFVETSGLLKALAVNLMKIAGDLRLMNTGPRGGLGEIRLAPVQAGSTIMPGKVNPVIPEMTIQAGIRVCAHDQAIATAAARGEFELNAFLPLIADSLLGSLELLKRTTDIFRGRCIDTLAADEARCRELLDGSLAFATAYVPLLGYDEVARIIAEEAGDPPRVRARLEAAGEA